MGDDLTYDELKQRVSELEEGSLTQQNLERKLRESEARYRRMLSAVTNYVFSVKIENSRPVQTIHNYHCEAITGYTLNDFESDPYLWIKMVPVEDHQIVNEQASCILSGGTPETIEHRIIKKDGTLRWVSNTPVLHYDANGNLASYDGLISDISTRKRAEEELIRERDFSQSLVHTAQVIILVLNPDGTIRSFNPYMEDICGYKLEEVQGKDWFETFLPHEEWQQIRDVFRKALGDIKTCGNVNPIVTKDGSKLFIEWYDKTLRDLEGNISGLISIGRDITEQMQAEEALKKSEAELKTIIENSATGITVSDLDGHILRANPAHQEMLGYSLDELNSMAFSEFTHPEDIRKHQKFYEELLSGKINHFRMTKRFIHKKGPVVWTQVSVSLARDTNKKPLFVIGMVEDITAQKLAEEEKEKLIVELQKALEEIKTLRGIIPICSHCKQIRDDKGFWHRVETYIENHSDAAFSHGICPSCLSKFHPEIAKKNKT